MTTVLVAVSVALLSGFAGALVQVSHESRERVRDRMLFAADDFSTGVTQAMLELHEARARLGEALRTGQPGPAPNVDPTAARERVDIVHSRLARVELLFGDETAAGKAAGSILSRLRATLAELELGEYAGAKQQFELAQDHQGAFNREARRAMVHWRTLRS